MNTTTTHTATENINRFFANDLTATINYFGTKVTAPVIGFYVVTSTAKERWFPAHDLDDARAYALELVDQERFGSLRQDIGYLAR